MFERVIWSLALMLALHLPTTFAECAYNNQRRKQCLTVIYQ